LALSATVSEFQLDQQPFDDLLDAFRQDQRTTRYQTFDQILDYCQRSANPVGRIVLALVNCLDEENARLSDSICTGLQLANFLQDVASDFRRGRIYLAADQMSRFGVQESMFGAQQTTLALRQLLASECDRAEEFLRRGMPLSRRVPPWFAADVRLFAQGGLATLAAIRRIDYDVLRVRPTVSKLKQLALLLKASLVRF
jgi:squalene synthase HpnC